MDTIINFLKDIVLFLQAHLNISIDATFTLIAAVVFGGPFIALFIYAIVLSRRGKRMGITYDGPTIEKKNDNTWVIKGWGHLR
ncbi:MAG: hypothetical protein JRD93_19070 [Deltaproteobacteria bacterium]|nr:hypothetical protein [Deltaproteobacteria bacterium]